MEAKQIARDVSVARDRNDAVKRCFYSQLRNTEKPLVRWNPGIPEIPDSNDWNQLIHCIRYDMAEKVCTLAPKLLNRTWVEEFAAHKDKTHMSRRDLPAFKALDVALRSPDCSYRTLALLAAWVRGDYDRHEVYDTIDLISSWVSGFIGLQWPDKSVPMPDFLPHRYQPYRRAVEGNISSSVLGVKLEPSLDMNQAVPWMFRASEEKYVTVAPPPPSDEDELAISSDDVYFPADLNTQRLLNQASKLFSLLYLNTFYCMWAAVVAKEPKGCIFVVERGRHIKKDIELAPATRDLVVRVFKTALRMH